MLIIEDYLSVCLNTIIVTGFRFRGNVLRAGLSNNHTENRELGTVADDQAVDGAVVDFMADPVVTARYVSVDIPGTEKFVQLTEVMIEEVRSTRQTIAGKRE